jgi:hypothetical protein
MEIRVSAIDWFFGGKLLMPPLMTMAMPLNYLSLTLSLHPSSIAQTEIPGQKASFIDINDDDENMVFLSAIVSAMGNYWWRLLTLAGALWSLLSFMTLGECFVRFFDIKREPLKYAM